VWRIAAKWPLLKVQRSVASQDHEWQVSAAAVIGQQNLTGCSQPEVDFAVLGSCLHVLTYVVSLWAMLVCPEPSDTSVSIK
jgi:hypothetical protein